MAPRLRKFVLTVHVTSSLGWCGAVAAVLALAVAGLTSQDTRMVRAAYLAVEPITWFVILPLAFASLLSGITLSLGTTWGLFRHYWVVFKLLLTVFATAVLLMYTQTIDHMAGVAAQATPSGAELGELGGSLALHAGGGLLVLLTNTVLAVYKPRGRTRYGRHEQHERRAAPAP
jgi:predicted secreted protein